MALRASVGVLVQQLYALQPSGYHPTRPTFLLESKILPISGVEQAIPGTYLSPLVFENFPTLAQDKDNTKG